MDIFFDLCDTIVEHKLSKLELDDLTYMIKIYPCFIEDLEWSRIYFLRFNKYKKITYEDYLDELGWSALLKSLDEVMVEA